MLSLSKSLILAGLQNRAPDSHRFGELPMSIGTNPDTGPEYSGLVGAAPVVC
jgi:hypothetical protein